MDRASFVRRLGLAVALAVCMSGAANAATEEAKSTDSFLDSIGVNTHWSYPNVYQTQYATLKTKLGELGIRHIRDGATTWTYTRAMDLYNTYGIKHTMLTGKRIPGAWPQPLDLTKIPAEIAEIKTNALVATAAIEGPNEYDISHGGGETNWVTKIQTYQRDLYTGVRADPAFNAIPIVGPSLTSEAAYNSVGNLEAYLNFSCVHHYQSWRHPGTGGWGGNGYGSITWMQNFCAKKQSPNKPNQSTECGYHNVLAGADGLPEDIEAKYMPRTFAEFFRRGYARSFKYELVNEGTSTTNNEQTYGLLRNDLSEKPSYTALKNLFTLLQDSKTPFVTGALDYTLSGSTANIRTMLLQKTDGDFYLLIWQEVGSYNGDTETRSTIANAAVTVTFGTPVLRASRAIPNDSTTWTATTVTANAISLSVPDKIMIVRVTAGVFPNADAYVRAGTYANTNFGTEALLYSKENADANYKRDTYFKFDLSAVASVVGAKLRFYGKISGAGSVTCSAYPVATTTWTETGIKWNNKPVRGSVLSSVNVTSITGAWYELDVSNYVASEVAMGRTTVCIAIHNPQTSEPVISINSREATAQKPELIISE